MPTNVDVFLKEVDRFGLEIPKEFANLMREVVVDLYTGIVQDTPYLTGRSKASWTIGIGAPIFIDQGKDWFSGAQAAEAIAFGHVVKLASLDENPFQKVFLANGVPYIDRLEEGSSRQAPDGMVALNIARVENERGF
jgi:hypothetical protein